MTFRYYFVSRHHLVCMTGLACVFGVKIAMCIDTYTTCVCLFLSLQTSVYFII